MAKTIVISNRLPATVRLTEAGFDLEQSAGGLATGLASVFDATRDIWVGWPGTYLNDEKLERKITATLQAKGMQPVYLSQQDIELYYEGFSNKTLWPLFHYFQEYSQFNSEFWQSYKAVNEAFFRAAAAVAEPDDIFWIHDYQLLLLPGLIREAFPQATIGFFLHIPFPSYELFRILPWRKELLRGVLGADLVGFHTYDYIRHFLSATYRILGYSDKLGKVRLEGRIVDTDAFPISIDYDKFHTAHLQPETQQELAELRQQFGQQKLLLSIDRLDYSKGILQRLRALDTLLTEHPEYLGKVTLLLVVVPSRDKVDQYQSLKLEIDQYAGYLNGKYGRMNWAPLHYMYRNLSFATLAAVYHLADVMMVTPFRDGMNLVAKEYVAAKADAPGVLVLSEMAGAAEELKDALLINPNDTEDIVRALHEALTLTIEAQQLRMGRMQDAIKRYDIARWAADFMTQLRKTKTSSAELSGRHFTGQLLNNFLQEFHAAEHRLIMLDYDGTLKGFVAHPNDAFPDPELMTLLARMEADPKNSIALVSGRDKTTMDEWFADTRLNLVAEHGLWLRQAGHDWRMIGEPEQDLSWMNQIKPLLDAYAQRTPGAFVEQKQHSLVWHYRNSDPLLGETRYHALYQDIHQMIQGTNLQILLGDRVMEVRPDSLNKGKAARILKELLPSDLQLVIGDDYTDEDMFQEMGSGAYTVKVGMKETLARFMLPNVTAVRGMLTQLLLQESLPELRQAAQSRGARRPLFKLPRWLQGLGKAGEIRKD